MTDRAERAAYVKAWRQRTGDVSNKAYLRAASKAGTWVRRHRPDVWRTLLDEARAHYGLPTTTAAPLPAGAAVVSPDAAETLADPCPPHGIPRPTWPTSP